MALSVGVVVVDGPQAHIVLNSRVVLVLVSHLFVCYVAKLIERYHLSNTLCVEYYSFVTMGQKFFFAVVFFIRVR